MAFRSNLKSFSFPTIYLLVKFKLNGAKVVGLTKISNQIRLKEIKINTF